MKPILIRVVQRLLALFLLSAALAAAQLAPEAATIRETAMQAIAKLEAGSWQSCDKALQSIKQLTTSEAPADKELAEKLLRLCATVIEEGMQNLPTPPEQEKIATCLNHKIIFHSKSPNRE